jgi:hypothetical protein
VSGVPDPVLKVGLLSTWNTRCGIAEYSRHLVDALRRRGDVAVTVFGSRNYGDRAIRPFEDDEVACFDVQLWHPEERFDFDAQPVLDADLDVLHIQYANLFYRRRDLVELMRRFDGVIALTYHDKTVSRAAFPHQMADVLFTHREDVGLGERILIPQGIDLRAPVVKTFGLGKSRDDLIAPICERNGWLLQTSFGDDRWLEAEELFQWLRDSDAIVLWYDDDPSVGESAAAALAIGTRRPVFVNDTQWFAKLPERTATLRKVATLDELERELRALLVDEYAQQRSWDLVAQTTVDAYRAALAARDAHGAHGTGAGHRAPVRAAAYAAMDQKPLIRIKNRALRRGS